ncbi:MAG: nuclear transport factor 2 family protein [Woeseiaceae bacterium]
MQGEKVIAAFDRAWNERDPDGVLQLITPDCMHFDAYFADLVPAWNIAEYVKIDMASANVRYTITNIVECSDEIAEYNYAARILDENDRVISTYDGAERLVLRDGKICRMTDYYVAPPELLSTYYNPLRRSFAHPGDHTTPDFSIETILQCRRKLIRGMRTEFGYVDETLTLPKFARLIEFPEDLISLVLEVAFHREFEEFVTKCRIDCARDMIRQQVLAGFDITDLSVDRRIARKVGFKSHKQFVDAFAGMFGQTPREFRSNLRGQRLANLEAA